VDAYIHTRGFDRYGCIVGARYVAYTRLENWYVCRECGGNPVHCFKRIGDTVRDWAECAECGARDFIPSWLYEQQCRDYWLILDNLPDELRALFPEDEPLNITADEAMAQLFDL